MKLVRGLLAERGGTCVGCTERLDFVRAVLASLNQPLVARHALPLFQYDSPLFPHTQVSLHLFEPRYKLLCRKALKADRIFGLVSADGVGTLAKIKWWRFQDDDAKDGSCHMTVAGTRRFRLGRQWEDPCEGCDKPLRYADVTYLNDSSAVGPSGGADAAADAVPLVKQALKLHHAMSTTQAHNQLIEQLGDPPPANSRERAYTMSMWLAAACVASNEACKKQAAGLLATRSTRERLERVIKAQKAAVGKKYASGKSR